MAAPLGGAEAAVVGASADCAVAAHDRIVLLLWRERVVPQGAQWVRRAFLQARQHEGPLGFLTVAEASCDLKTPTEVREEISQVLQLYESRMAAAAIVFEGKGFRATMVRSVITAINLASHVKFPNSVFGDLQTGLQWLCRHDTAFPDPAALQRVLEHMRQQ